MDRQRRLILVGREVKRIVFMGLLNILHGLIAQLDLHLLALLLLDFSEAVDGGQGRVGDLRLGHQGDLNRLACLVLGRDRVHAELGLLLSGLLLRLLHNSLLRLRVVHEDGLLSLVRTWVGLRAAHHVELLHSGCLRVGRFFVDSLSLVVVGVRVLVKDLLTGHSKALEEEIRLNCSDHVFFFLGDEVTGLHLEVLLVLTLALFDVVAQGLLLDAGTDHFLLILSELLVRDGWLRLLAVVVLISAIVTVEVFLEVLGVAERRCPVEVGLEGALHIGQLALHGRVPVVLDRVVGATFENLGNLCPLVVDDAVHEEKNPLFLFIPVNFLNSRVEVVVPTLSALLAHAAIQVLGNQGPLLGSICNDELQDAPVLFGSPGALHVE